MRSLQSRIKSSIRARNPITKAKRRATNALRHPFKGTSKRRSSSATSATGMSANEVIGCLQGCAIFIAIIVIVFMFVVDSCSDNDTKESNIDVNKTEIEVSDKVDENPDKAITLDN